MNDAVNNSDVAGTTTNVSPLLDNIIRPLLKKKWLLLTLGFLSGVGGFFYAKFQRIQYQSNLTFVLEEGSSSSGISGALSFAAQLGFNIGSSGNDMFSGDNVIEVIKSRRLVESVFLSVDSFGGKPTTLIEYFLKNVNPLQSDMAERYKGVHFTDGVDRKSFSYAHDSLLYFVYNTFINNHLEVDRPDRKLSIFSIRVKTGDERFTKIITDKLIYTTDSFYTEICSKKAKETLSILEQRVANMKGNLSASISNKAATQDANLNPAFSEAQVPLQKQQANIQVYAGAYGEMFKNLELARFQYLNKIPLIQIIDRADYPMKYLKTSKLKTAILFSVFVTFFSMLVILTVTWLKRSRRNVA